MTVWADLSAGDTDALMPLAMTTAATKNGRLSRRARKRAALSAAAAAHSLRLDGAGDDDDAAAPALHLDGAGACDGGGGDDAIFAALSAKLAGAMQRLDNVSLANAMNVDVLKSVSSAGGWSP